SFDLLRRIAMGADLCNSARGMMLALGCIQALRCNSNECPTGVATSNKALWKGIHVPTKADRVASFQHETIKHFKDLLGAMGYEVAHSVRRADVYRRLTDGAVKTYEDLFPSMPNGFLLQESNWGKLSADWHRALYESDPSTFLPTDRPLTSALPGNA